MEPENTEKSPDTTEPLPPWRGTEEEAQAMLDQAFLRTFGKTYRDNEDYTDDAVKKVRRQWPHLFGEGTRPVT